MAIISRTNSENRRGRIQRLADETQDVLYLLQDKLKAFEKAVVDCYPEGSDAVIAAMECSTRETNGTLDEIDMMLDDFVDDKVSSHGDIKL